MTYLSFRENSHVTSRNPSLLIFLFICLCFIIALDRDAFVYPYVSLASNAYRTAIFEPLQILRAMFAPYNMLHVMIKYFITEHSKAVDLLYFLLLVIDVSSPFVCAVNIYSG